MKRFTTLLLLCCFFGWHSARAGTCNTMTPQISTLSVGTINVQRDAPVGTVIFSGAGAYTGSYLSGCSNPLMLGFSMRYNNATLSNYGNHVYNTNVSGIGIRLSSNAYFENPSNTFSYNAQTSFVEWYGGWVELVVTGPVSSGALTPGAIGVVTLQGSDGVYRDGLTVQLTGGTINALACSITTPQLTFPIGDISASAFGSVVGTTPTVAQNTQNLGVNCSPGTNIMVSLSGIQNPDGANTSVMALTGQGNPGTAKGIGVQLLYNGTPLALNSRLLLKQSSGGQETLPLTARYYQTLTSVESGSANASATLNLTYQ
ncbi:MULTISPECIES: fimbrial protein [Enterobacter]|uniref:fimbrial protein n=1 Tax=Enterobacter TaxID=547 RepID=UPI0028E8DBB5|nr:fimbrial protein [Enterobacter cloacae]HDR2790890.1 fimbrial protein [Enterobacter asburiae]WNT38276.1 fimbrial protein [Enterobacter cloacae]HDR2791581.1 fimbrial protein [Enterobacter asburiae]HDR2796988.1 fimbrial protein [Enterobacter asburiae]HDR2807144.1 fimbrial protein [Enterobacter asburiae]